MRLPPYRALSNGSSTTPDDASSTHPATVPVQWRYTNKGRDFSAVEGTQFGEMGQERVRNNGADTGHASKELIALAPERRLLHPFPKILVILRSLFSSQAICDLISLAISEFGTDDSRVFSETIMSMICTRRVMIAASARCSSPLSAWAAGRMAARIALRWPHPDDRSLEAPRGLSKVAHWRGFTIAMGTPAQPSDAATGISKPPVDSITASVIR